MSNTKDVKRTDKKIIRVLPPYKQKCLNEKSHLDVDNRSQNCEVSTHTRVDTIFLKLMNSYGKNQ